MTKGTVLVVDDDTIIVDLVADALALKGYHVLQAVGGASLPLAHDEQPGVILLDLNMPGMDGAEVGQRLRSDPATAHIPIIIMSAQRPHTVSRGLIADAWLTKPFRLQELYAVVAQWLPRQGAPSSTAGALSSYAAGWGS